MMGLFTAAGILWFTQNPKEPEVVPVLSSVGIRKAEVVGFLPYWLIDSADKDYSKYITTLTYFGLAISSDGSIKKLNNPQEEEPGWTTLKNGKFSVFLNKLSNKNIKQSLLVISGDEDVIKSLLSDPIVSANNLMNDVAPIMKDNGFTDLNIDVESFLDASGSARLNFSKFVTQIKNILSAQNLGTLTIDIPPIALVKNRIYDAKALGEICDKIILMTYDYHYFGSFMSGANAPVNGAGLKIEFDTETAVKEALKVIPTSKIIFGIPLYGYQWETLSNASESATIPDGASIASSRRISEMIDRCATCSVQFDKVSKEPYLIIKENDYYNQIYFENEQSLAEKVKLAEKYNLGGTALWALGYEDRNMLVPLESYKNRLFFNRGN